MYRAEANTPKSRIPVRKLSDDAEGRSVRKSSDDAEGRSPP